MGSLGGKEVLTDSEAQLKSADLLKPLPLHDTP